MEEKHNTISVIERITPHLSNCNKNTDTDMLTLSPKPFKAYNFFPPGNIQTTLCCLSWKSCYYYYLEFYATQFSIIFYHEEDACLSGTMLYLMHVPAVCLSGWHCLISFFLLVCEKVVTWHASRPAVPQQQGKLMFPFSCWRKTIVSPTPQRKGEMKTKIYFQMHTRCVRVEHVHLEMGCKCFSLTGRGGVYLI